MHSLAFAMIAPDTASMWKFTCFAIALFVALAMPSFASDLPSGWQRDESLLADKGVVMIFPPDSNVRLQIGHHEPPPETDEDGTAEDGIDLPQWLRGLPDRLPETISADALDAPSVMTSNGISLHSMPFASTHPQTGERTRTLFFLIEHADGSVTQAFMQMPITTTPSKAELAELTKVMLSESMKMSLAPPPAPSSKPSTRTQPSASTGGWTPIAMSHTFGKKSYNAVSGLWRFKGEAVWTHYRNGWAVSNLSAPLSNAELDALRREDPDRFRKIAGDKELRKAKRMTPAKRGTTYDLALHQPSTGSTGIGTYSETKRITLRRDGTFETSAFSIANGAGTVVDRSDRAGGRYAVDGLTITLTFTDGSTARLPFATDGRESLVIGDEYFWKE